ncbi:hypothetical protein [Pseudonocardia asaccharolytica]|uniref:Uncharacterized protein n=1 Tax=Pseudonocardia asaccharolytica DSM 44247 = NBRC 16224 TaxID=1123024 RepID=A0A511D1M8_9PSEU|nr:hypothetical protein [Pseudonocardia asaccharolytica]GEL18690.1 hypothetical protein PA7_25270 [Pseudonocardia asaccharolytica DSM 44247 = NBRC 16224]
MIQALVVVVWIALAALAVFGIATTASNRPPGRPHKIVTSVVVALLLVQAMIAAVRVFGGVQLPESTTFLIYLVVSVCVLPIGLQFATAEPTRWGGAVLAVAAIATGVVVWRLQDLWVVGGA